MTRWLPAIDYPATKTKEGFWFPQTSTINWCEEVWPTISGGFQDPLLTDDMEDYYATIYAAEIVNTLTNLLFIYLGIKGIRNCLKHGHDTVFLVTFLGYLAVGTGSFMFHSTLKYPWQLVDELSMIYTTCLMCYACFSFNQSRKFCQYLATGLAALCIFITVYYHNLQDPTFHQNAYALLTAVVVFRSMYVMEVNIRPSLRSRYGHASPNGEVKITDELKSAENAKRDEQVLRDMWLMIALGLTIFLGGFGIWTLDNEYCSTIRNWRRNIGLPWGLFLEGHGWWHLMTGTGAYMSLVWGIWLRHCLNERQDEYELHWPSVFSSLPEIIRSRSGELPKAARKTEIINGNALGGKPSDGYAKKEI